MKKKIVLLSSLFLLSAGYMVSARSVDSIKEDIEKTKAELSQLMIELRDEEGRDNWSINDVVELDNGVIFTITDVYLDTPGDFDDFSYNMLAIEFTIDNQSDNPVKYNSHNFTFYDGDRTKTELNSKEFFTETIDAGMKANGVVYYDVKDLGDMTFQFEGEKWTVSVE